MAVDIDDDLDVIAEQVAVLRDLNTQPHLSDATVYDFSIRWGAVLAGRVPRLVHYRDRGLLSAADVARVHEVCAQLRELSAPARRLGLAVPPLGPADAPPPPRSTDTEEHR